MAIVATYPVLSSDWLRHELDARLNREEVTIVAGAGILPTGTVMGKISASGKYKRHVNGAGDGTQTAVAVLLNAVDASGGTDVKGVLVTGNAEIVALSLSWDASVNDNTKKNAALAQLATLGFKTRPVA